MAKRLKKTNDQLTIPFEELIKNTSMSVNYDFENMKKYFLPKHPILNFPLFLPLGSDKVLKSRVRYRQLFEQKEKKSYAKAALVPPEDLIYIIDSFVIKADSDYGLPDEFDGMVYDCIAMAVSKEYSAKDKTYLGYRIDENIIMKELENQGYKRGGSLHIRIKASIDRLYSTSYQLYYVDPKSNAPISHKIRLINEVHRKGKSLDGKHVEQTIIVPNASILEFIKDKKYHIIDNQSRYKLTKYISKTILEKFYKVIKAQIFGDEKEMYIAIKENNYPYFVTSYQKFCKSFAFTPRKEKELRPGRIKEQLQKYLNELEKNKICKLIGMERNKSSEDKDFNLIFIFYKEMIDYIFESTNKRLPGYKMTDLLDKEISAYYGKMETQIQQKKHKDIIKKVSKP